MKAEFQTQEGSSYVLRSVVKNIGFTELAGTNYPLKLHVNQPDDVLFPDTFNVFKLDNQTGFIIPVMAYYNVTPVAGGASTIIEVETPFYTSWSPGPPGGQSTKAFLAQAKMYSQTRLVSFTTSLLVRYVVNYETFNLSNSDFIDCGQGMQFIFTTNQRISFSQPAGVFYNYNEFPLATGSYQTSVGFLYLELLQ